MHLRLFFRVKFDLVIGFSFMVHTRHQRHHPHLHLHRQRPPLATLVWGLDHIWLGIICINTGQCNDTIVLLVMLV